MKTDSVISCIFLGTSIGLIFNIELVTYFTAIFAIMTICKLLTGKHKKGTYIYGTLMILYYCLSLYYTILAD